MPASDGVLRAVQDAWKQAESDLDLDLVTTVLQIEVQSQFNSDRGISVSQVSEAVETAIADASSTAEGDTDET